MTQEELAAKARVSREYVSMLEGDKKSPTLVVFLRLCKAMNASASQIVAKLE